MKVNLRSAGVGGGITGAVLLPFVWTITDSFPVPLFVWVVICLALIISSFFVKE